MFVEEEQATRRARPLEVEPKRGDTVSFSAEALALARSLSARQGVQAGVDASDEEPKDEDEKAKEGMFGFSGGGIVLNGKQSTEEELAAEIQKAQEEVDALYKQLQSIMGMNGDLEEKIRLSQPVDKQLQEKLELLSSLKGMQADLKANRQMAGL